MDRALYHVGPLTIYTFGVTIAAGALAALWLTNREAKRNGLDEERVSTLLLVILLAGVMGARIFFILFYDPAYYLQHPLDIFKINEGGLSIHGGILGAFLAGLGYCKKARLPFWPTADLIAPMAVLGQGIARVGCDVYGKAMTQTWLWGVTANGMLVHPVQIYETLLDLALFIYLWGKRHRQKYTGQIFINYLAGYSMIRLFLEFFRTNPTVIGGLTPAHITSLLFIVMALIVGRWLGKSNPVEPTPDLSSSGWVTPGTWAATLMLAGVSIIIYYALALR